MSSKWTEVQGKFLNLDVFLTHAPQLLLGGRVAVCDSSAGLDPVDQVDVGDAASRLRALRDQVAGQFIGRGELADAMATALAAGEHCFVLGPPGTAKSAVIRQLAAGLGGRFWRIVLNPDTTREDLVGPLDPDALKRGQWRRKWGGIASADVAFLDECWKASPQVSNMMLDALEERRVTAGDDDHSIPLLSAVGASNEVPEDKESRAAYDRWLLRLTVGYLRDPQDFQAMLTISAGTSVQAPTVKPDEIRLLAAAVELVAMDPPQALMDGLLELWRELGQNGRAISDRRWRKTLKAAVAYAFLHGETPGKQHLAVARWTLWSDPDEEREIADLVLGLTDPVAGDVLAVEALLAELKQAADGMDPMDFSTQSIVGSDAGKLMTRTEKILELPAAARYAVRAQAVFDGAEAVAQGIMGNLIGR